LRVVAARAFNHSGPGQSAAFLVPALIERAREAKESNASSIRIGNPTPVRDYLHVEDVARAYLYLALRGEPGQAYNVASGAGISVAQLAELILEHVQCEARLDSDPALTRAGDIPVLIGDAAKLSRTTSWTTRHTLEMMIDDMIDAATN
jgi:GDP-4-dehydro-6-deoxy-D-mannose reductase